MNDTYPIPAFLRTPPAPKRERPILFSAPMVRAILAGTKTQTRRVCKLDVRHSMPEPEFASLLKCCPYGRPGDRLWVRESFSGPYCMDAKPGRSSVPPSKWGRSSSIWYWADGNPSAGDWTKPRPSIHMPRWASRILLEIVTVRVERLQAISERDAEAEGCQPDTPETWWQGYIHMESIDDLVHVTSKGEAPPDGMIEPKKMKPRTHLLRSAKDHYRALWESINGAGSWSANPWVWVVEFKRVKA